MSPIYHEIQNAIGILESITDFGVNAKYIWVNGKTHHASTNLDSLCRESSSSNLDPSTCGCMRMQISLRLDRFWTCCEI